ncbi:T9SS type B sorting domain-containing protein [Flavobacterium salilacus subsp. salilacus]|uniref:T9SS type B sorting domain-containing protein n=1 Tax=Flavobacterium TaxID=237 RepID=UPI0013C31A0F|nr:MULTISPECIES: T9SS type B sorting domain-containing protein [Flavobacterium]KAF2519471.1 T9SS type B sorting domain-containing protein [Flavobacterium salilacus subsp. salilacus]MBE1614632.1 T9SS type B sorting domain-containing protein [Flavobacterium sp. SaA2.13]
MNKTTLFLYTLLLIIGNSIVSAKTFAPVNDDCSNATTLTVNSGQNCSSTTLTSFSAATVSPEGNTCTATTTGDIWYQFTATATSHTIALSNFTGTAQPVAMVLYEGADCSTFTQVYCSINNVINATSLIVGETYKLRLYFNAANPSLTATTFRVCVNTPPPPSDSNQSDCVITTINYDFELPVPIATVYPIFLNHNVVQGWRTTASDQMMEFWPVPNYENVPSYSGNQFIELNANLVSGVYQDYQTPETTTFSYGFAHRGRQGTDTCQLLAGPPGGPYTPVGSPVTTGNTAWSYNTGTYDVPAGQTVTRFIFQSVSSVGGASVGNYLDAITFTANNGILSPNPYSMDCGDLIASVEAAGTGTWVAHDDNPSTTTIADISSNSTTISGFGSEGLYYYDWVTEYCVTTLEISFSGDSVPPPVVADVVYCQGETATELTAEVLPGNYASWFAGSAPTPNTAVVGTTNYYVSQVAPSGCESIPAVIVVTVNALGDPVTDFTLPASVCFGSDEVQPQLTTGFTAGGTYSAESGLTINPETGAIDPSASTPGDYNVTYTVEANSCNTEGSNIVPITINPVPETPDFTLVQPDCFTATGSITINSPLGADYTYSINGTDYQPEAVFPTVLPGIYTLYVQNTSGCITTYDSVTINPALVTPAVPAVTITQPTCAVATATITVNSPVGAEYTYSINGIDFQPSPVFNDVLPDNYTITVQNTDGCMATTDIVVNPQPPTPLVPDVVATQPDCDVLSGTLTVNSPTGAGLTYSIDGVNYQTSAVFSGLPQGSYSVTVMNSFGCSSTSGSFDINLAPVPVPVIQVSIIQPTCAVATATVTIDSPVGAQYTYSINGTDYQSSPVFNDVLPNDYTITIQNTDGCMATTDIVVNPQPPTPNVPNVSVSQPDCSASSGTLTVTSPIGAVFFYSIDGVNYQISNIFSGLPQGSYLVSVMNGFGCISTSGNYVIDAPPAPVPSPQLSASQPDCATGLGTISVGSPLGSYTYSIDGVTFQNGTLFTGLIPGTYTILVKSVDGCIAGSSINIYPAPDTPAVADITVSQPDCSSPFGTITINNPTGAGLTYSIDGINFQMSTVISGLVQGNYTITVKNNTGCISVTNPIAINSPLTIPQQPVITAIQPTCDTPTGTITVISPTGAGLTYSIDGINYQPNTNFTGLTPGITYNVTVQNAVGCTAISLPLTIHDAPEVPAIPTITILQPDCEQSRGTITVDAPVGAGFKYSINGIYFQPGPVFTNVVPGTYTITVRSADGCTASDTAVVTPQPATSDSGVVNGPSQVCETDIVQYTNTTPDGVWSVSNESRATINDLGELTAVSSGNVIVYYTVQNPGECAAVAELSVWVVGAPTPDLDDTSLCLDIETGEYASAELNTGLSAAQYSFVWYKGTTTLPDTEGYITVTEPGEYSVDVTSLSTGCTGTVTATVVTSSQAEINVVVGADFDYLQSITINIINGSGDYEYQLNNGDFQDSPVFTGITQGEYSITVRDKNGCGSVTAIVYALNYPRFFSPNGDGVHDTWFIDGLSERGNASIYIFDRYGKVVGSVIPGMVGWDGTLDGEILPATDYWFTISYESFDGSSKEFKAHFSLIR